MNSTLGWPVILVLSFALPYSAGAHGLKSMRGPSRDRNIKNAGGEVSVAGLLANRTCMASSCVAYDSMSNYSKP